MTVFLRSARCNMVIQGAARLDWRRCVKSNLNPYFAAPDSCLRLVNGPNIKMPDYKQISEHHLYVFYLGDIAFFLTKLHLAISTPKITVPGHASPTSPPKSPGQSSCVWTTPEPRSVQSLYFLSTRSRAVFGKH